jgi:hypothetical protein
MEMKSQESNVKANSGRVGWGQLSSPGLWDPLDVGLSNEAKIGYSRHTEIQHGRVVMGAAFLGDPSVGNRRPRNTRRRALFDDGDASPLTAENEPEEFFSSDFESMAPEDKIKDPLVLIGLGSIFFPFVLLLGFQATGVI